MIGRQNAPVLPLPVSAAWKSEGVREEVREEVREGVREEVREGVREGVRG